MLKELYVMGLIPEPLNSRILKYQKYLSQVYNLYDEFCPKLHITLGKLGYNGWSEVEFLIDSLNAALKGLKPVRIEVNGTSCFGPPHKSVNIHVEATPELKNLSILVANTAIAAGMSARDQSDNWQYHISIANPAFARNEWSESEYNEACELVKKEDLHTSFLLNQMQLWHPVEKDYVVHSFRLG